MSRQTCRTSCATDQGIRHYAPAIFQPAQQLVAKNQGRFPQRAVSEEAGEIRSANAGHLDRHFCFHTLDLWAIPVLHFNLTRGGVNQCSHAKKYMPPVCWAGGPEQSSGRKNR